MMQGQFTRFKFTTGIFYKPIEKATFNVLGDYCFEINISPYFTYSARYFIHSIAEKERGRTIFNVVKADFQTNSIEEIDYPNKYYLTVYEGFKKIAIFDVNMDGIILKR